MTEEQLAEIIGYRNQIEECPRCESDDIEFVFNILNNSAPKNFTARCRACEYTMHDNDPKRLLAKWNAEAERSRRIDYANDEI